MRYLAIGYFIASATVFLVATFSLLCDEDETGTNNKVALVTALMAILAVYLATQT